MFLPSSRLVSEAIILSSASGDEAEEIAFLLRSAGLPADDFRPHLRHFVVARTSGGLVGAVGAEVAGSDALLRSLVVAPAAQNQGVAGRLLDELDRRAAEWGVERWWLLTTTAEQFFSRRGFRQATRCAAPAAIQATGQFSGGCGSAAVCMTRERGTAK